MSATAFCQTLGQQTITFMNCVDCDKYFEPNVNTIDMVGLIISSDTIYETEDYDSISKKFYENFAKEKDSNTSYIFLNSDDMDILAVVIQKDIYEQTRAMYLLTHFGWLESVDMQDFSFFDKLLLLFRQPTQQQVILKRNEFYR